MPNILKSWNKSFWHSSVGLAVANAFVRYSSNHVFGPWTAEAMRLDTARLRARLRGPRGQTKAASRKLHLGCGPRIVPGWLNADVVAGDCLVDLACGRLPWVDQSFDAIVCQQVIEHLELYEEAIPLLREMRRVTADGGEIWLACPDLEKVCRSYVNSSGADMLGEYRKWYPRVDDWKEIPSQVVNLIFTQDGEHKNLFDLPLLTWACAQVGLTSIERVDEVAMLRRFPEFPARGDDHHSLYVCIKVSHDS